MNVLVSSDVRRMKNVLKNTTEDCKMIERRDEMGNIDEILHVAFEFILVLVEIVKTGKN